MMLAMVKQERITPEIAPMIPLPRFIEAIRNVMVPTHTFLLRPKALAMPKVEKVKPIKSSMLNIRASVCRFLNSLILNTRSVASAPKTICRKPTARIARASVSPEHARPYPVIALPGNAMDPLFLHCFTATASIALACTPRRVIVEMKIVKLRIIGNTSATCNLQRKESRLQPSALVYKFK